MLITDDLTQLEVARGLLESSGITTSTSGMEQAKLLGTHLLSGVFGKKLMGARLLVQRKDEQLALGLLDSATLSPDERCDAEGHPPEDALDKAP